MKVIVFDTETIGKISQDLLNIGYKIIDIDIQNGSYKTLVQRDYVITPLISDRKYCINDDFVGSIKYNKYLDGIENKTMIKRSLKQAFITLGNDIIRQKVLFGYAYNCKFDLDKLSRDGFEFPIPVFDIWNYAYDKIISTPDYKKWCLDNNQLTETEMYIKGSVESVSRYLKQDVDFQENHTALSDVENETDILMECVRLGSDITRDGPKHKNIPSGKVFHKTIKYGETELDLDFTKMYERNGVITYK